MRRQGIAPGRAPGPRAERHALQLPPGAAQRGLERRPLVLHPALGLLHARALGAAQQASNGVTM
jgi:hypothetical protein